MVAQLAGGAQWFAAYEVIETGTRRTLPIADVVMLGERGAALHAAIVGRRAPLRLGEQALLFDEPLVAGILNVTPDSFSDGGGFRDHPAGAIEAGRVMAAAGAAIIDVGGESTRPGASVVSEREELKRVALVIERLAAAGAIVSIDTRKAAVMEAALAAGAQIVNDVSALLWDDRALGAVASAGCSVVLMHSPDPRAGPHGGGGYRDVLADVLDWLEARIDAVVAGGVDRAKIVIDPGIGFGKSVADNLALMNGLAAFHGLGCPVMVGASRKRMIGALSHDAPVGERLAGSIALALKGVEAGVQLLRVHDVAETVQALGVWRALRDHAMVGADGFEPPTYSV